MAEQTMYTYTMGSAAPAEVPQRRRKTAPTARPKVIRKSRAQLKAEAVRSRKRAITVVAIVTAFFLLIGFQICCQVKLADLNTRIADQQKKISTIQAQNAQLEMKIDSNVSLAKVDDYAKNELGMVKVKDYQVNYVKLHDKDAVLVSGGKTHSHHQWHRTTG